MNLYHVTKFSPYFSFTLYCFYTKVRSFTPVLTIWIVGDCFYLLVFYSKKFSFWVWRLPFAVNVNLNLSNAKYTSLFSCYKNRETTSEWQNHSLCQTNMSREHFFNRYKQIRRTFENFLLAVLSWACARTSEKAARKVAAKQPAGAVRQPRRLFALTFLNKRVS